jgi:hypothetical protein
MRKRHTMLTPRGATCFMPETMLKMPPRLTPRSTARNSSLVGASVGRSPQ